MRAATLLTILVGATAVWVAPAQALPLKTEPFRYTRAIEGAGERPVRVEPDGPLFAHTKRRFADLRFTDARGRVVPWRFAPHRPILRRSIRAVGRAGGRRMTVITVDLGDRDVRVDALRVRSRTRRYDRRVWVSSSEDRRLWLAKGGARLYDPGAGRPAHDRVPLHATSRFVRLLIPNGDNPPLRDIRVFAAGRSPGILVEGGHPAPYRAWYGAPHAPAPVYDFETLSLEPAARERVVPGRLGQERRNPRYVPPPPPVDRRSFLARHQGLVAVSLALAAIAVAVGGGLALRRPRVSV